uniref:Regulator of G protein signaling 13a n=1 Tax=Nothobranchius furzeri TaxID=105023 RepID=A0A8C6LJH6_NOTFU
MKTSSIYVIKYSFVLFGLVWLNREGNFKSLVQPAYTSLKLPIHLDGIKIFQAFLKSEFSDENLEFWAVCEDYKKIRCSFRMSFKAKKIFKLYIRAEAPREINIDHKTRELIRSNMKVPSMVCFDDAQKIVYGLMEKDSYPRFLRSDVYRTLLDSTPPSRTL